MLHALVTRKDGSVISDVILDVKSGGVAVACRKYSGFVIFTPPGWLDMDVLRRMTPYAKPRSRQAFMARLYAMRERGRIANMYSHVAWGADLDMLAKRRRMRTQP